MQFLTNVTWCTDYVSEKTSGFPKKARERLFWFELNPSKKNQKKKRKRRRVSSDDRELPLTSRISPHFLNYLHYPPPYPVTLKNIYSTESLEL